MRFHDNTPSGGRKVIYDYANYLAKKGHDLEIIYLADVSYKMRKHNLLKHIGHYVNYVKESKKQKKVTWMDINPNISLKAQYSFNKNLYQNRDIVIAFDYGIALNISETDFNLDKVVYVIQGDEKVYNTERIVRAAWSLPIQKVVVSSWLYDLVSKYDKQVHLVKNYVRSENFYVKNPINNRRHVVSLINHTNKYKGTDIGLKALNLVHESVPDLKVLLFGNFNKPIDLPDYVQYIKGANQDSLRDNVYNKSSIFLFTSFIEGWGLVATEAMACGAALVSTKNGGVNDFGIENETALLNDVGDYEELANNVIYLFNHDTQRITLAKNGAELMRKFTFESSALNFEKVLTEVIGRTQLKLKLYD